MAAQFTQTIRSLRHDSSRLTLIAWIAAAALFSAWLEWFATTEVGVYEVSTVARVEVTVSPHPVAALASGKVTASSLEVGREVQAGDVLAVIDSSDGQLRLAEAEQRQQSLPSQVAALHREIASRQRARAADIGAAQAAGQAAESRRRAAEEAAAFAEQMEQKTKLLHSSGLVPSLELTNVSTESRKARAASDALAAEVRKLELDAQAAVGQQDAAIEALRHTLASLQGESGSSRAAVARLTGEVDRRVIRAPIGGRLGDVSPVEPGSYVAEGQVLAAVVPQGVLMVVADFDPGRARGRVHPGQVGQLRLDGFPWTQFGTVPVTVSRVSSEVRQGLVRVELEIGELSEHAPPLEHGLPGRVELHVENASPATLALRAAGLFLGEAPRKPAATPHTDATP